MYLSIIAIVVAVVTAGIVVAESDKNPQIANRAGASGLAIVLILLILAYLLRSK